MRSPTTCPLGRRRARRSSTTAASGSPTAAAGRCQRNSTTACSTQSHGTLRPSVYPTEDPPRVTRTFFGTRKWWWTEGQIVASPRTGVAVLNKTHGLPYMGLIRVVSHTEARVIAGQQFIPLPGAEKKFGCVYDPVSERFYALTNPVLPANTRGVRRSRNWCGTPPRSSPRPISCPGASRRSSSTRPTSGTRRFST